MVNDTGIRNNIITLLNSYESEYGIGLRRIPFKNIQWENDFYSHIQALIHATTADDLTLKHFANRSAVKKSVMLILFDIYTNKNPPYYKGFKMLFPAELKLMDMIKRHPVKNIFPTMLQSLESKILLDHTCKDIGEKYPELPILTIHDSIVCGTEYLVQIQDRMEKSLEEIVGIKPGLKIEDIGMDEVMENISSTVNTDWETLCKSLKRSGNKDWVSTFNEEPKEIPLRNTMVKMGGRIYLDKRMALLDVVDQVNEDDYVEELDYPDKYYQGLGSEYDDQE